MAAERVGITSIVRTPGFDRAIILRLLDMGVQGIQVPHVSSAESPARQCRRCAIRRWGSAA
jgi:2-keto-3-deoxy-L-rhamnonate aldolase RhmA